MSIKQVLQIKMIVIIIAFAASAGAQERPAPESAPVIDLPAATTDEPKSIPLEQGVAPSGDEDPETDTPASSEDGVEVVVGAPMPSVVHLNTRRPIAKGKVILAFDDVSIDETLSFITQTIGKVVIPINANSLRAKKITLRNDEPIDRETAFDLLIHAFRLNQVGVIERDDIIIIGPLEMMLSNLADIPVLGVDTDVMQRQDRGTLVLKVFSIEQTEAAVIGDRINEMFPDYGSLTVYPVSNQLVLLGDVGLCQQIQLLIDQLDQIWKIGKLRTFRLKYADATEISNNIFDIFEDSGTTTQPRQQGNRPPRGRTAPTPAGSADEVELRLTVNMQQNSVTVQAEPEMMEEIGQLIDTEWDLPRPVNTSKMYVLKYSDPITVRDALQELLGEGSTGGGGGARGGQAQRADVTQAVSGVYRIEAYPDKNALLVLAKTEESLEFLDSMIADLDTQSEVGIPRVIELKHADALTLSEELNALLAAPGVSATIEEPDSGLSGEGFGDAATATDSESGGRLNFPWQQGGANADSQSPVSALIGKVRIVPIARQNAISIMTAPQHMQSMIDLVEMFDKPKRQVMISATIVAVTLTDALKLGLRWGSGIAASGDNSIGINGDLTGSFDNVLGGLFNNNGAVFTLGAGNNIGVVLDALNQLTNVRMIQQPRTFTSDNQESVFFNGSQVPIRTTSNTTSSGLVEGGFDYRDVGVMLNIRPRITANGDVDLTINVELSDQVGTGVGDNPIFSRRQVKSQVQLHNGQTVLIGGILKENESKIKRKFPLLGDIPFIGEIFNSVDDTMIQEELLIFITPVVVNTLEENDNNFNLEYLERLQEISLPLDEQLKNRKNGEDHLTQRLRNLAKDSASDDSSSE